MKLKIGLNENLHTECNLFLCPSPEHWAARCRWSKHLNTLEKGAVGTDIWAFLLEELVVQWSPPVNNPTYIRESFQSVL